MFIETSPAFSSKPGSDANDKAVSAGVLSKIDTKKFATAEIIKLIWKMYDQSDDTLDGLSEYVVYKRGLTTMKTKGEIEKADCEGDKCGDGLRICSEMPEGKPFSEPGDSGSVVFVDIDNLLVPLGLHYMGDSTHKHSFCIPLWKIFRDFCRAKLKKDQYSI
jgi:hypothetical protein